MKTNLLPPNTSEKISNPNNSPYTILMQIGMQL